MTRPLLILAGLLGACSARPAVTSDASGAASAGASAPRAAWSAPHPVATPRLDAPPPDGRAAPDAEAPCAEPIVSTAPPALYRPLFEPGRRFTYRVDDDVDPHGPRGGRVRTAMTIDCTVTDTRSFRGAVASVIECQGRGKDEAAPILPAAEMGFVAAPAGLWLTGAALLQSVVDGALAERPLLEATPSASRRSFTEPGMFAGSADASRCSEVVEVRPGGACRDVRCQVASGYGPSRDRLCFGARGLESLRRENLNGPRVTTWTLLETRAAAPVESAAAAPPPDPCR